MEFTPEQKAPIHSKAPIIVVKSAAGSGKTTILEGYAKTHPTIRMLYLCYNKAIQKEAESRFPKNVICRTGHSIAHHYCGKQFQHKLGNLRLTDVKKHINARDWDLAADAVTVFEKFLASADRKISQKHIVETSLRSFAKANPKYHAKVLAGAKEIWEATTDPRHPLPTPHDVYLKLYCLDKPNLAQYFGCILFDEAQDANPVVSDLVVRQECDKFIVGDDHQQLYRWRGAENSLTNFSLMKGAETFYMTQSWRFGPKIAKLASQLLKFKKSLVPCDIFELKGLESISDEVYLQLPLKYRQGQLHTILHRTVSATIETAILNVDKNVFWIGGIDGYSVDELLDVYYLSAEEKDKIKRKKLLVEFKTFEEYKEVAESSGDGEMNRIVKLIKEHSFRLPSLIRKLRLQECKDADLADVIVSTAHRSKGLEFPYVQLADDFSDLVGAEVTMSEQDIADEVNLLYVACTRATRALGLNDTIISILMMYAPELLPKRIEAPKSAPETAGITRKETPSTDFTRSIPISRS